MVFFDRNEEMVTYFVLPRISYSDTDLRLMQTSGAPTVQLIKKSYSNYNDFAETASNYLLEINHKIIEYNQIPHSKDNSISTDKITILQEIFRLRQALLKKFSDKYINQSPSFRSKIQRSLFADIKVQAARLQIGSLNDLALLDPLTVPPTKPALFDLSWLIANMTQEKAEQFCLAFNDNPNFHTINTLYQPHEPDYLQFRKAIVNHAFDVFTSFSSTYIEITSSDPRAGKPLKPNLFLKIDDRRWNPRDIEASARLALPECFVPIITERQVTATLTKHTGLEHITRDLLLMPYCNNRDLKTYSAKLGLDACFKQASNIFSQIATILEKINRNNFWHSDLRIRYFLLDDERIFLGNCKGLLSFNKDGNYYKNDLALYHFTTTPYMAPPECVNQEFNASLTQTYLFGKLLYQYLTQCKSDYMLDKHNGLEFDFKSYLLFNTPPGQVLQFIIMKAIQLEPTQRMPMHEIVIALNDMNIPLTQSKKKAYKRLFYIQKSNFDKEKQEKYIQECSHIIDTAGLADMPAIHLRLDAIYDEIEQWQEDDLATRKRKCHLNLSQLEALPQKEGLAEHAQKWISDCRINVDGCTIHNIYAIECEVKELYVYLVFESKRDGPLKEFRGSKDLTEHNESGVSSNNRSARGSTSSKSSRGSRGSRGSQDFTESVAAIDLRMFEPLEEPEEKMACATTEIHAGTATPSASASHSASSPHLFKPEPVPGQKARQAIARLFGR